MNLLRRHSAGIVFSFLVGVVIVLPNFVFLHSNAYRGIPLETSDESFYLVRLHAAYRGCTMSCNPYLKNQPLLPSFDPSISETILAAPGRLLNVPVTKLQLVYDFLLPFILALLAYTLLIRITKRRDLSIVGILLIFLGYDLLNPRDLVNFSDLFDLLRHFNVSGDTMNAQFLLYARPVNPQFSSIVFFGFLAALLSFIKKPRKLSALILFLIYAFSFYVYFYLYSFTTAVLAAVAIIYTIRRAWPQARMTVAVLLAGLCAGAPIIGELWRLIHDPLYHNVPIVLTLGLSHLPVISAAGLTITLTAGVLFFLYIRRLQIAGGDLRNEDTFFLGLFLGGLFVIEERVLTGISVQNFHYEWYYLTPVFIIGLAYAAARNRLSLSRPILITVILLIFANAFAIDYRSYLLLAPQSSREGKETPVLNWLTLHTPKGSAVYSDDDTLEGNIPIYTDDFVFWSSYAAGYIHPETMNEDAQAAASARGSDLRRIFLSHDVGYAVMSVKDSVRVENAFSTPLYSDPGYLVYKVE